MADSSEGYQARGVWFSDEQVAKLEALAERHGTSVSVLVRLAVDDLFDGLKSRRVKIQPNLELGR